MFAFGSTEESGTPPFGEFLVTAWRVLGAIWGQL